MNTQTHVLLAVATLSALAARRWPAVPGWLLFAAVLGALVPDATLFAMVGIGKWQGVADAVIFGQWYYEAFWQSLAAITNSIPLYLGLLGVAWALRSSRAKAAGLLGVFAVAALLHALTDLPLHHDDGRPHFWPFSDRVFASPVSYWDPAHHGRTWSVIEWVLAAALIIVCWRALRHPAWRVALLLGAASYAVMAFYWAAAFG